MNRSHTTLLHVENNWLNIKIYKIFQLSQDLDFLIFNLIFAHASSNWREKLKLKISQYENFHRILYKKWCRKIGLFVLIAQFLAKKFNFSKPFSKPFFCIIFNIGFDLTSYFSVSQFYILAAILDDVIHEI